VGGLFRREKARDVEEEGAKDRTVAAAPAIVVVVDDAASSAEKGERQV
jgi:hypothetical protein